MALNPEEMATMIESAVTSAGFKPLGENTAGHAFWLALSTAIVAHFQSKGEVIVTGGSSAGTYKVT